MQRLRTHKLPNYTCVYQRVVSKYRSDLRDDRHELSTGAPGNRMYGRVRVHATNNGCRVVDCGVST